MRTLVKCTSWLIDKWNLIFSWWNTDTVLPFRNVNHFSHVSNDFFRMVDNYRQLQRTGRILDIDTMYKHKKRYCKLKWYSDQKNNSFFLLDFKTMLAKH